MVPVREKDGEAAEYKGLAAIMQPLGIYFQALLHFCPDGIERELGNALHLYPDLLYTLNRSRTLESSKTLHFTFHRKRIALGIYNPAGWEEPRQRPSANDPHPMGSPPHQQLATKGRSRRPSPGQEGTHRPQRSVTTGMKGAARAFASSGTHARHVEVPTLPWNMRGSQPALAWA